VSPCLLPVWSISGQPLASPWSNSNSPCGSPRAAETGGGSVGSPRVRENLLDHWSLQDQGDDPHRLNTALTQQGQAVIDPSQQYRPKVAPAGPAVCTTARRNLIRGARTP